MNELLCEQCGHEILEHDCFGFIGACSYCDCIRALEDLPQSIRESFRDRVRAAYSAHEGEPWLEKKLAAIVGHAHP